MSKQHGPWRIEGTRELYHTEFIALREDQVVQPDGKPGVFALATLPEGVAVLPMDETGQVHLTRQFRYALGNESVEVVSGALDEGEAPLAAAQREAKEELGIEAEVWHELGRMDALTSNVYAPVHLFLAQRLTFSSPEREGSEKMDSVRLPFHVALQMVLHSTITHSPSCVLLLKADHWLRHNEP